MTEIMFDKIFLPNRNPESHKGDFGKVLLICGSEKYTGAAFFSAQAAVNTGSGLVYLAIPDEIRAPMQAKLNEPILLSRDEYSGRYDATLIGCGLALDSGELVAHELYNGSSPLIIDADAITVIARDKLSLKASKREIVLTPHEGEFLRLCPDFDHSRREEFASNFAKENECTLVLKGHRTLTATKTGELFINTNGNPGMAKGGSGDILSGIITSLVGQGIPVHTAAYTGVWLHGRAGDIASKAFGEYAMTPTDMLATLKSAICEVEKRI